MCRSLLQVAGAQLRSCTYADGTLEVGELRQPPASLQVLAEALLPGGVRAAPAAPALAGLVLREAALSAEALQACPLLEGLRLLHLRCCWAVPDEGMAPPVHPWAWTVAQCGDLLPGVQLLLGQAPALEQLMLSRCRLGLGLSSGAGGEALDVSSSPQLRRLALHSAEACTTARLLSATFPAGVQGSLACWMLRPIVLRLRCSSHSPSRLWLRRAGGSRSGRGLSTHLSAARLAAAAGPSSPAPWPGGLHGAAAAAPARPAAARGPGRWCAGG